MTQGSEHAAVGTQTTGRRTRRRHALLISLFVVTAINYLDRTNMAVALPHLSAEFHLGPVEQGVILSAFAWTYAALQLPGGWLVDRVGSRLSFGVAMVGWSLCTVAFMAARGFGSVLGLRLALGAFEAPAFPANNRLVANWFPPAERARATATYTAGEYIGLAVAVPLLSLLTVTYGWRSIFLITGVLGLVFSVVWFRRVRDTPASDPRVGDTELAHIRADDDTATRATTVRARVRWADVRHLLSRRRLWGMYIGMFANVTVLYFFLTWFPTYLVEAKHMGIIKAGVFGSVPYVAALLGVLFGGWWSDRMIVHGVSRTWARKAPIVIGFLVASVIVAANYTESVALVIAIMSVAFFAQGMTALGWTLVAEVAPVRLLGLTGGMFNFFGNIGGVLAPLVVGVIVGATGSFAYALVFIAAVTLLGLVAYLVLLDRVERLDDTATPASVP